MQQRYTKYVGTVLILLSISGFLFFFSPFILIILFPPPLQSVTKIGDFSITIPKIHAQAKIVEQVDPWNQVVYDEALKHGVAQAKGTAYPGKIGTLFLFAHSSQMPWEITSTNTPFLLLGELHTQDSIYITYKHKIYTYKVISTKEVWPLEVSYLNQNQKTQLILQTCTPLGTSLKRLLVFARFVSVS